MLLTSPVSTSLPWVALCSKIAPMAVVVLNAAPLPTIQAVKRKQSVGDLPLLPHTSMISNGFVWVMYGALKREFIVWAPNLVGVLLGSYYFSQFVRFSPKESPTLPGSVTQHIQIMTLAIGSILAIAATLPKMKAADLIGKIGVAFCIALFASPLAAVKTVLKTKSAASIPLPFTLATVFNCYLWIVVGVKKMRDPYIYFPNCLGLSFGFLQLAIKLMYREKNSSSESIAM